MEITKNTQTRNIGIDALRMLSMLMVTVLHVVRQGGVRNMADVLSGGGLTGPYMTAWFLEIAAYCAVNCYALISGYVGVRGKYRYANLAVLWLRVVFYTVGITAVFALFRPELVGREQWQSVFFPVFRNSYWYFTSYVGLFLFIPLLNQAVEHLDKKQFLAVLVTFAVMFSVLPTVRSYDPFGLGVGYSVWWLMILYVVGGYIRKYGVLRKLGAGWMFAGYFLMVLLTWCLYMAKRMDLYIPGEGLTLASYTSPPIVAAAVFLLLGFERLKVPEKLRGCIRFFAPLAFSAYLLQAHALVWDDLLNDRFSLFGALSPLKEAGAVLGTSAAIYVACSLVDLLREGLFKVLRVKERLISLEDKLWGLPGWRGGSGTAGG